MSETSSPSITQEDLDAAIKSVKAEIIQGDKEIIDAMTVVLNNFLQQIELYEKTQQALEQQIALLVMAYAEQTVAVEALVAQIVFRSAEERKAFNDRLDEAKIQMLKVMKEGVKNGGAVAETDPRIAAALEDLVNEQLDKFAS